MQEERVLLQRAQINLACARNARIPADATKMLVVLGKTLQSHCPGGF
jgi:hypothetical protein